MNCQLMSGEILDFHFGVLPIDLRSRVEQHLLECKGCLKEYLNLKSDFELGKLDECEPSKCIRHRIKVDFLSYARKQRKVSSALFHEDQRRHVIGWMAAAAAIALIIATVHFQMSKIQHKNAENVVENIRTLDSTIDSASQMPESINIL